MNEKTQNDFNTKEDNAPSQNEAVELPKFLDRTGKPVAPKDLEKGEFVQIENDVK